MFGYLNLIHKAQRINDCESTAVPVHSMKVYGGVKVQFPFLTSARPPGEVPAVLIELKAK
jgi:hypothetical protein